MSERYIGVCILVITVIYFGNKFLTYDQGLALLYSCLGLVIIYQVYIYRYFHDEQFITIKNGIEKYIKDCNKLNEHIRDLKATNLKINSYDYGNGKLCDTSSYVFKRQAWAERDKSRKVHFCSSSVLKNASDQPFKYLCKYFDIGINEKTLSNLETALNNYSAAEQGKILLENERDRIFNSIRAPIPSLILFLSKKRLMEELGFKPIDLHEIYFPSYTFKYVSAGGNSSYSYDINLDMENLEKFICYLGELIKFKNSVSGQRALMTRSIREKIKSRDNYTCKLCGLSVRGEKNLLLEIDHIIPLSKGGMTSEENLQTLCWRCNRSKGAKLT